MPHSFMRHMPATMRDSCNPWSLVARRGQRKSVGRECGIVGGSFVSVRLLYC
jgi:hypothetical protein